MPSLDDILARFDLPELEEAVERRRRTEETRLNRLLARRRTLEKQLRKVERELDRARAQAAGAPVRGRTNARRLNDISLADALEKVLRTRKKPVHYRELTDTVLERGLYRTRSKNLLSTVAVTLKRDDRFRKVEPGFYTLT
ncbi:MAG: hypothetical protein HKN12_00225 [Gemmatimonadetes bacterium]|nr:hypothetical protein [Gemmatimonadota bacterium]